MTQFCNPWSKGPLALISKMKRKGMYGYKIMTLLSQHWPRHSNANSTWEYWDLLFGISLKAWGQFKATHFRNGFASWMNSNQFTLNKNPRDKSTPCCCWVKVMLFGRYPLRLRWSDISYWEILALSSLVWDSSSIDFFSSLPCSMDLITLAMDRAGLCYNGRQLTRAAFVKQSFEAANQICFVF